MDLLKEILGQNPWWQDADSINNDEKVVEWAGSLRYEPRLMYSIQYYFADDRTVVYTLRGPRQVGKTTLVKLQIKKFLDKDVHPLRILYCTMDLAQNPRDVVDIIETYMEQIARRAPVGRRYLFLDEISSVSDWQKGIKWMVDTGNLRNCTVIATGSHSIDLKNAAERLPGRKGDVNGTHDKILMPMKFSEYVSVLNADIRHVMNRNLLASNDRDVALRSLASGKIDERLDALMPHLNTLNLLLDDYMVTGGLPRVVSHHAGSKTLRDPDYETYTDMLAGEWTRLGKSMVLLKAFGMRLVASMGSPVAWAALAEKSGMGSPNTAQDYADTLEMLFMASVVYRYDTIHRHPLMTKNKKIYFTDPFFLHMFRTMTGPYGIAESSLEYLASPNHKGSMLEGIVANHLVRLAFVLTGKKSTFDHHSHVFYWRDAKSREVDFVLDDGGEMRLPLEVKSGDHIGAADLAGLTRLAHSMGTTGVALSRSRMAEGSYVVVPASIFLALV